MIGLTALPGAYERLRGDGRLSALRSDRDLGNGETLFHMGGCVSCHASGEQDEPPRLGGGAPIKTAFGIFYPPNISPDRDDGIGAWAEVDFIRAMRDGERPDGSHYYPAFPFTSYRRMDPDDLADLFAFLKTLPPVRGRSPGHQLAFPYSVRPLVGFWKLAFLGGDVLAPSRHASTEKDLVERGRYLVEGPGHCAECHSPRNMAGAIVRELRFAGGPDPEGKGWVPNLTPGPKGLSDWSVGDIAGFLKDGVTPDGDIVGGSMGHVVRNTGFLSEADRRAIALYLKSLPPRFVPSRPAPAGNAG